MNLLAALIGRSKPAPVERRFYAATKRENREAHMRGIGTALELRMYCLHTTPEQRRAETEAYWAKARLTAAVKAR